MHVRALREATAEDGTAERTLQTTAGDGPAVVGETVHQAAAGRGIQTTIFSTYTRRIRTPEERDLAEEARRFIRPDEAIWLVVGHLAQVEAGIRELNLYEVIRLDLRPRGR